MLFFSSADAGGADGSELLSMICTSSTSTDSTATSTKSWPMTHAQYLPNKAAFTRSATCGKRTS